MCSGCLCVFDFIGSNSDLCFLSTTAADGPDNTCCGTHINRGTPIWTSEWVMNLNPFWSMSANTSRKVKSNALFVGLRLVGCKTISKVVTHWILSVGKCIISSLTGECVQCSKMSIRCASVEACLWNLLHMTVIWAQNETVVNFSTFQYCYLTCVWHVQGIELHLNCSSVHCTVVDHQLYS